MNMKIGVNMVIVNNINNYRDYQSIEYILSIIDKTHNKMSQRYQSGKLKYKIEIKKQKVSVQFGDKFGLKYLTQRKLKDFIPVSIQEKYKSRKKNGRLQLKLKQIKQGQDITKDTHRQLIAWLQQNLDLDWCYFKALRNQNHIQRNNRFREICQKQTFQLIYPEIHCLILIETSPNHQVQFLEDHPDDLQKSFLKGELIIYIQTQKKHSIKQITKYLQSYTAERVVFGLDEYFGAVNIRNSGFSLNQFQGIINKIMKYLLPLLKQTAIQSKLIIKSLSAYVPGHYSEKYSKFQNKLGVEISLQGMFQSLPQFYFSLDKIFKDHPVSIGKVQDIQFYGSYHQTQQKYLKQGTVMFFGSDSAVAILNLNNNFKDWVQFKRQLRKGDFIISQIKGFTLDQMQILIRQHRDVQNFMNEDNFTDFVNYEYKPIDEKSFSIYCQKEMVGKFVGRAFEYLRKNVRVEIRREQFVSEFQMFLFMKLIRSQIESSYPTVSFSVKNGVLFSRSKESQRQAIAQQMKNQRRKILKKIVRLPTIKPLQKSQLYQINQDEFQTESFCNQFNLKTLHYQFNDTINIYLKTVNSIRDCHPLLIPLIDRDYEQCQLLNEHFTANSLSLQKYQKYSITNKANDRLISYSMGKSKYVNQMLVWYIETDQRRNINLRTMKWDIQDFVLKFKNQTTLSFVVPEYMWNSQYYFANFFLHLFKQLKNHSDTTKVKHVNIFYETNNNTHNIRTVTKAVLEKANIDSFVLKSQMHLSSQQIQNIILLQQYSATCWLNNQNKFLSPLNSFIFNYQKTKKYDQFKVPLFLKPLEDTKTEYLLCLKQSIFYKIQKHCKITQHQIIENTHLQKFSQVIRTYFRLSQYIVVYMNQEQTQIEGKKLYFWAISINNKQQQEKIKRLQINDQQKLIKKNSEVNIFVKRVDIIPKFIIETHQDFIPEVKKIIFQED